MFLFRILFITLFIAQFPAFSQPSDAKYQAELNARKKPMFIPLVERYILDELKSVRIDQQALNARIEKKLAEAKLDAADRAISYTADTTNNIFFIITAACSVLVIIGWNSLREVKSNVESTIKKRLEKVSNEYESRMSDIESKLKERSKLLIETQETMAKNNNIHSLWVRAALETNDQEKIKIYNDILAINPDEVEALTYKADVLLELDETQTALSLCRRAITLDKDYPLAYWQKACAESKLDLIDEAVADLQMAINISPQLRAEIEEESCFKVLPGYPDNIV